MPWTQHPRLMTVRRRVPGLDLAARTWEGFGRHQSGRNAGVMAYYGFLSIFPLILVFTTILGFVLRNDPELQEEIVDSSLSKIPIIGDQLSSNPAAINGKVWVLIVGVLTALWASMRMFVGLQSALNDTAGVGPDERPSFITTRVRALIGIGVVGISFAATSTFSSYAESTGLGWKATIGVVVSTAVFTTLVVAFIFRYLCAKPLSWRGVWPGSIFIGLVFAVFQLIVVRYIARAVSNAETVYGDLAGIIALLSWLSTHATVTLLGAELNQAIAARTEESEL